MEALWSHMLMGIIAVLLVLIEYHQLFLNVINQFLDFLSAIWSIRPVYVSYDIYCKLCYHHAFVFVFSYEDHINVSSTIFCHIQRVVHTGYSNENSRIKRLTDFEYFMILVFILCYARLTKKTKF